jgi:hypothetical protein
MPIDSAISEEVCGHLSGLDQQRIPSDESACHAQNFFSTGNRRYSTRYCVYGTIAKL